MSSPEQQIPASASRPVAEAHQEPRKARAADRILKSAHELFYRQGIRAVGVDEIVEKAGVTKPSLYRNFPSKDELAAAYLRDYEAGFWSRFEAALARHPGDPRAQIRAYFEQVGERHQATRHRGCALTNAVVEFPELDSPARAVSEANKRELLRRLTEMTTAMGARDPVELADGLLMLFEGAHVTGQIFRAGGPVRSLGAVADRLMAASIES